MENRFWAERWDSGRIGFHRNDVHPHLLRHGARLGPPGRVLVPLCGKSLDLVWLRKRGHEVWGIEFVESAARAFFAENALVPETREIAGHLALAADGITIVVADLFALAGAPALGTFTALYDRAALVAIEPARRTSYLQGLRAHAGDEARLLLVTFDHDIGQGPPFSVPADELKTLTTGLFDLTLLEDEDIFAAEPRLAARGATRMREQSWIGPPARAPLT